MRKFGSDARGGSFSATTVNAVWNKGALIPGYDGSVWRRDACGATMKRSDHGNTASKHGWEVDHVKAAANGGTDDLPNLQPLQWENNRAKSDGPLKCVVKA